MTDRVLFLGSHAAARSLMALSFCRREVAARGLDLAADCAGADPDPHPMPEVVALLAGEGLDEARRLVEERVVALVDGTAAQPASTA